MANSKNKLPKSALEQNNDIGLTLDVVQFINQRCDEAGNHTRDEILSIMWRTTIFCSNNGSNKIQEIISGLIERQEATQDPDEPVPHKPSKDQWVIARTSLTGKRKVQFWVGDDDPEWVNDLEDAFEFDRVALATEAMDDSIPQNRKSWKYEVIRKSVLEDNNDPEDEEGERVGDWLIQRGTIKPKKVKPGDRWNVKEWLLNNPEADDDDPNEAYVEEWTSDKKEAEAIFGTKNVAEVFMRENLTLDRTKYLYSVVQAD